MSDNFVRNPIKTFGLVAVGAFFGYAIGKPQKFLYCILLFSVEKKILNLS